MFLALWASRGQNVSKGKAKDGRVLWVDKHDFWMGFGAIFPFPLFKGYVYR